MTSDTLDLSPQEMADSVYAEAVKECVAAGKEACDGRPRSFFDNDKDDTSSPRVNKRTKLLSEREVHNQIREAWTNIPSKNGGEDVEVNPFGATITILSNEMDGILQAGSDVFSSYEAVSRQVHTLKEDLLVANMELDRLRAGEDKNRKTIGNLLRASETSKAEARESSQVVLSEATLRAELSVMTSKCEEAVAQVEEYKRKSVLLDEQLHQIRTKLSRVTSEKIKLEREQRTTLSLARSLESDKSEMDYYKKKALEQNSQIQGLNAVIAEKNRHLEELRRQMERNLSRHRVASISGSTTNGSRKST